MNTVDLEGHEEGSKKRVSESAAISEEEQQVIELSIMITILDPSCC